MKTLILGILLITTLFLTNAIAENAQGAAIFEAKGCVMCHKKDMDTVGPSLQTIAIGYLGRESALIAYLQGQGTPIIDPSRASVMAPQLIKIRTLFEEEMRALAEHIVSAADRPF